MARCDIPINQLDQAAFYHDVSYSEAQNREQVRYADVEFLARVIQARAEDPIVADIITKLFKGKMLLEDQGLMDPMLFVSDQKEGRSDWVQLSSQINSIQSRTAPVEVPAPVEGSGRKLGIPSEYSDKPQWNCCQSCDTHKSVGRHKAPCEKLPGRELKMKYLSSI